MSDDLPLSDSSAPAGGEPAPPPPAPPSAAEERSTRDARGRFAARAERAGLDIGDAPAEGAEGVSTPTAGERRQASPVLDGDRVNTDFAASRARRKQEQVNEAIARRIEKFASLTEHDVRTRPEPAAAAAAGADDPEPDREEDYWKWQDWRDRQLEKRLLSSLEGKLKPVLSFAEQQEQFRQQQEEQQRLAGQRDAWYRENRSFAQEAHEQYSRTEEGREYMDRILYHVGDFGDPGDPARGIPARPPSDGVLSLGWQVAFPGMPPAVARELAQRHFHGFMSFVQRWNEQFPDRAVNPAVALDRFTRVQLAAGIAYQSPGGNGSGSGYTAAAEAEAAEPQVSPRIAALRKARENAGPVAGAAAEAGNRNSGLDLKALARGDSVGVNEMRALAQRKYGSDSRANMLRLHKDLLREANSARQAG